MHGDWSWPWYISTMQNIVHIPACSKCVNDKDGSTCCAFGGSWFLKCGAAGDPNFEYTWDDGVKACEKTTSNTGKCQLHVLDSLLCQRDNFITKVSSGPVRTNVWIMDKRSISLLYTLLWCQVFIYIDVCMGNHITQNWLKNTSKWIVTLTDISVTFPI